MSPRAVELEAMMEVDLEQPLGQMRAVPVETGGGPPALLLVYSACAEVDPYHEMFFFPTDTLKLLLLTPEGEVAWRRELGRGVVPGMWFCPVFPFDLDGDGAEEVWFVNNLDDDHPLGLSSYRLERIDARDGRTTGRWPWRHDCTDQSPSHLFRNFILGGHVGEQPVLVTAQGTYGDMFLQGWDPGVEPRWDWSVGQEDPGARGSHMCPIVDLDGDGRQQVMWGERCIELDAGRERFCADRDAYRGHSDVVQPVFDREAGEWLLYTCRESDPGASPRVVTYEARGETVWGAVEEGHMDMGWVARIGEAGRPVAMAVRIGQKTAGPGGFAREGVEEFAFDAISGEPLDLPFGVYGTVPVDLNGDGCHELVRARSGTGADGAVVDRRGRRWGTVQGAVALACKMMEHPGEQLLTWLKEGTVRITADRVAEDAPAARRRFRHPLYAANRRLGASGYNLHAATGI
ncbi:MAG: hypothetical protein ACOC7T_03175 [Planctomycetota bacterium]